MDNRKVRKALAKRPPPDTSYEVGYGKPPTDARFQKGKSGNPKGRPKGSKNKMQSPGEDRFRELILKAASREVEVSSPNLMYRFLIEFPVRVDAYSAPDAGGYDYTA